MADTKISALASNGSPSPSDLLVTVDVSDTSMSPNGTDKKALVSDVLDLAFPINLAADVSGDLPLANLAQGSALSVLGVAGNATADNASIAAASDGQVLRRSGTSVGFGAVNLASANAVTGVLPVANFTTGTPTGSKFVRDDGVLSVPGGGGDVVGPASSVDKEIALFDATTGKLLERATGSGIVRVSSGVYGTPGAVDLTSEVTGDLPFANFVQASAASKLVGRGGGSGAGDFEEITLGTNLSMSGTTLNATGGGGGGGGLTLLGSATASASAALDFTSLIDSTYDVYLLIFENLIPTSNGASIQMRFSTNNGSSFDTSAIYNYTYFYYKTNDSALQFSGSESNTLFNLTREVSNASTAPGMNGEIKIFNPLSAARHKAYGGWSTYFNNADGKFYKADLSGYYASATAVDAIRIMPSTSTLASGVVYLYGLEK